MQLGVGPLTSRPLRTGTPFVDGPEQSLHQPASAMSRGDADFGDPEHPNPVFDGSLMHRDMSHQTTFIPQQPSPTRHLGEIATISKDLVARFDKTRGEQFADLSIKTVLNV